MKLLVIILNYRVTDLVINCLGSLQSEIASVPGMKVAVCENGSGADAEQRLRAAIDGNGWNSWAELTAVSPNLGFTGGNNVVIRKVMAARDRPEYLLLLNADTIVHPGAMSTLVEFMERSPRVGIAASRLENPDGSEQVSAHRFYSIVSEFLDGIRLGVMDRILSSRSVNFPTPEVESEVDWVPGCSMIIRREVVEQIGGLDEGFYTYFDDIDYCWHARRAGWSVWCVPKSRITHLEGAATGVTSPGPARRRPRYWFQARRRFWLKNHGPLTAALADCAFVVGRALWRVRRYLLGKPNYDPPYFLRDFIRNSVLSNGFKLQAVENPALKRAG